MNRADSAALGMVRADPRAAIPAHGRASSKLLAAYGHILRRHGDVATRDTHRTREAWHHAPGARGACQAAEESETSASCRSTLVCHARSHRWADVL